MSNLRINTGNLEQQQIERLLAQKAEIDAQLTSILSANASTTSSHQQQYGSPTGVQKQQRRNNVPRSFSSTGAPTMARQPSDRTEALSRSRTHSQHSAPMARTNSRGSASQRSGNIPFTSNGPVRPMPRSVESRHNSTISSWTKNEEPFSGYTLSSQAQPLQRSMSQRKSELGRVPEHTTHLLEDPSEYISRTYGVTPMTPTLSISPPMSSLNNHRLSTGSFNYPMPSTPSDTLTNATTLTSNTMSRTNSINEPLRESLSMMRVNSSQSSSDFSHVDQTMFDQASTLSSSSHNRRSSNEEQSQLLVGAGGASSFSHSLPTHFPSSGLYGEKMEKSVSNESNSSSLSTSSRNKRQLQIQLQMAARPIMPKGGSDENAMSRGNSSQSMTRLDSKDGSLEKHAIAKSTYQRPKHDRVYCKQCDNHPEGFRGEHELRRHHDREHQKLVRKWVCTEPTGDGLKHPQPIIPLAKCKACGNQKKRYGAYYNAAAHLRRTHFRPKTTKIRSKSSKENDEKRGGKGGGEWPPMSELKYWMKEVEEAAPEYSLTDSQQDENDASEDELENSFNDQIYSQHSLPNLGGSNNFNSDIFADAPPLINAYQPITTTNNNNNDDLFAMQLPLDIQSQCMDQTMYNSSSQGSFPNFNPNVYQNDPLASFYDTSLSQNFEDQVLAGPGFDFSFNQ